MANEQPRDKQNDPRGPSNSQPENDVNFSKTALLEETTKKQELVLEAQQKDKNQQIDAVSNDKKVEATTRRLEGEAMTRAQHTPIKRAASVEGGARLPRDSSRHQLKHKTPLTKSELKSFARNQLHSRTEVNPIMLDLRGNAMSSTSTGHIHYPYAHIPPTGDSESQGWSVVSDTGWKIV